LFDEWPIQKPLGNYVAGVRKQCRCCCEGPDSIPVPSAPWTEARNGPVKTYWGNVMEKS
jgi:hypothetical protein